MGKKKNFENKETFAERHPRINAIIGLCILLAGIFLAFVLIRIIILQIGQGIEQIINFLKNFVSTTDKVIIVAMITGAFSACLELAKRAIAEEAPLIRDTRQSKRSPYTAARAAPSGFKSVWFHSMVVYEPT